MTPMPAISGNPLVTAVTLQESLITYLLFWLLTLGGVIAVLWLIREICGLAWFGCWDRYICPQNPVFIFRNDDYHSRDQKKDLARKFRSNWSKTSFLLTEGQTWQPGLLKGRRRFTIKFEEISFKGKYLPKGGNKPEKFYLNALKEPTTHRVRGLPENYLFMIEPGKK
ncbi:MAG: hypothetical protein ACYC6G_18405 [Desulfobaccales bacterium]